MRFENGSNQALDVDREKREIYEPCIKDLANRFQMDCQKFKVVGLLFGARGSIPTFTYNALLELGIKSNTIVDICLKILKDSVHLLNFHLYH